MKQTQQGFTLIELMIVVAIIGILVAIALPQYQNYVAKSQVTRAIAEVSGLKTPLEECIDEGDAIDDTGTQGCLYTKPTSTILTSITVSSTGKNEAKIVTVVGLLKNVSSVIEGKSVTLTRTIDKGWTCSSDADIKYTPKDCREATATD